MKRTLALGMLAVAFGAPISATAEQTGAPPASQLTSQLASQNARFTLLDQNGNVVGFLVSDGTDALALRQISRQSASAGTPSVREFRVDYSKALTPEQMDAAYRAAYDEFFHVDHSP